MSLHTDNSIAAAAAHREYFGEGIDSENRAYYRETDRCDWTFLDGAVVHGEFIQNVRRGNQHARVTKRHIFCDQSQITNPRVNAHIRIGGECGQLYNVSDITRRGTRLMLHCERHATVETTRPGYRAPGRR